MLGMSTKPDVNEIAARVVRESTSKSDHQLSNDIEATWERWIAGVGHVDERARLLLRAAFDVGVAAANRHFRN